MVHECVKLEITIDRKLCNLIRLYWSSSQNMEEFKAFVKNLDLNIAFVFNRNPYLTAVIGYFNANSRNWYKGNKTSPSGFQIGIMTSDYGFTQIINEPTHILKDYLS